ncbi:MAG: hypothetical protein H0U30_01095 [Actinobacteria bacterium]|nr:hypothetical protein [Actinomycetota bacterium]
MGVVVVVPSVVVGMVGCVRVVVFASLSPPHDASAKPKARSATAAQSPYVSRRAGTRKE